MPERLQCEFQLIRYVPDAVRGEFCNIGVLLRRAGERGGGAVRFTRDWSRVRLIDGDADTALLEAMEGEIAAELREGSGDPAPGRREGGPVRSGTKPILDVLEDTLSNGVQISEARACLAETLPAEMEQLMGMYVDRPARPRGIRVSGRAAIAGTMRREFERAGVWSLMRKRIPAAAYTGAGDPLRLDCGYRAEAPGNGLKDELGEDAARAPVRMFQAVSLGGEAEAAKGLAFSAPRLRDGVLRVEGSPLDLTAVVEPLRSLPEDDAEARERYGFAVRSMEEALIRVVTVLDLARVAETARREMGV